MGFFPASLATLRQPPLSYPILQMGLLRALFITATVFFVTRIILERFVNYLPERIRPMLAPHIPLVVVFLIELLL